MPVVMILICHLGLLLGASERDYPESDNIHGACEPRSMVAEGDDEHIKMRLYHVSNPSGKKYAPVKGKP